MPIQLSGSGSITGVSTLTSLASLDVTGSVSVGGTLIYDDVTNIDSLGIVTARSDVHVGAGLSVTGISTFNNYLDINGDINIDGSQITYTSSSNQLKLADDTQLRFGSGNDLRIYHGSGASFIQDAGSGSLFVETDGSAIRLRKISGSENLANFYVDGAVELYYDNSKKFETHSSGVVIIGNLQLNDSNLAYFGTSQDLEIRHDGSHSYIKNNTGNLYFQHGNENMMQLTSDGNVELYYDNTKRFETTNTGTTVTGTLDLSDIDSSISDTAVDVFVYDTRKDSDGGAWRKRTQHTSWYNETLNTSTRGSRREFPAVAVIVTTATNVTIYDGDDPDLPMWMDFQSGSYYFLGPGNRVKNSAHMLNGILCVTKSGSISWMSYISFVDDKARQYSDDNNEKRKYLVPISYRNSNNANAVVNSIQAYTIVNDATNDVSMTVLPNAPIDDATGLPVPTIAAATDGGISVITDSGSVYDLTTGDVYDVYGKVEFDDNNRLYYTGTNTQVLYSHAIPSADQNYTAYNTTNTNRVMFPTMDHSGFSGHPVRLLGTNGSSNPLLIVKNKASGSNETSYSPLGIDPRPGLSFIDEGETNPTSMVAYATTSYNTGWMHGDIKGAFLSDTDTTNATSGEILTNGDFTNGTTGWTLQDAGEGSISVASNQLTLNNSTSADPPVACYQQISLEVGKYYNVESNRASGLDVVVNITTGTSNGGGTGAYGNVVLHTTNGDMGATFLATQASMYCYIRVNTNATGTAVMNSVSIRKVEVDRSHNITFLRDKASALTINGTVTKSAVATGADLVAYGPFNNNNNFRQPYNSNLRFVQNDFSIMFWVYDSGVDQHCTLISRDEREFDISRLANAYGNKLRIYTRNFNGDLRAPDSSSALPQNKWVCVCVVYTDGNTKKVYLDGVLDTTITGTNGEYEIDSTTYGLNIGVRYTGGTKNYSADGMKLALMRISGSAPSAEQVKKMYEDEKVLFQENAKCTLYGSSDAVTALAYDEDTELLHVGTSSGRSDFQGLRRINNTTTAVTTAISASDELIAEQ
jgi:hypothetical protein